MLIKIYGLCLVAIFASIHAAPVTELSDSILETDMLEKGTWFISFYSPSCGHCKRLEPAFDEAARRMQASKMDVRVARIDATYNRKSADKYGVQGYPTIVLIHQGKTYHYSGDRSVDSLISFCDRMSSPTITDIKNIGELKKVTRAIVKESAFIYVGDQSGPLFNDFKQMAERRKAFNRFYHVANADIFKKLNFIVHKTPTVYVAKGFDDFEEFVPDDRFSLPFDQWVVSERFALVSRFSGYDGYTARDLNKLVILALIKGEQPTPDQLEIMTRAARTARGRRFVFAWTNETETHNRLVGWFVRPISVLCVNLTDMSYYDPADQEESMAMANHQKLHPNHETSTAATALNNFNKLTDFIEWVDIIRYSPDNRAVLQNMVRGGLTLNMRLKRMLFTIIEFVVTVYNESVILFLLFFGLPLSLFSLLFYLLCCTGDHPDEPGYDDLGSDIDSDIDDDRAHFSRELEEGGGFVEQGNDDDDFDDGMTEVRRRPMIQNQSDA